MLNYKVFKGEVHVLKKKYAYPNKEMSYFEEQEPIRYLTDAEYVYSTPDSEYVVFKFKNLHDFDKAVKSIKENEWR